MTRVDKFGVTCWRTPVSKLGTVKRFVLGALLLSLASLASAEPWHRIELRVNPYFQSAPGSVRLVILVHPLAENRALTYGIIGPNESYTFRQLDGDKAQSLFSAVFPNLPAGDYEAYAIVTAGSTVLATERKQFKVLEQYEKP